MSREDAREWTGGAYWHRWGGPVFFSDGRVWTTRYATWPYVRLRLCDGGGRLLYARSRDPELEFRWPEVREAERVRLLAIPFFGEAVRFTFEEWLEVGLPKQRKRFLFFTGTKRRTEEILGIARSKGVEVSLRAKNDIAVPWGIDVLVIACARLRAVASWLPRRSSKRGGRAVMGTKERRFSALADVSLEDLVPEENFYRRLEARLDLSFVRELVRPLYANGGRPSVDPAVFFKLQLIMFFEDIRSERQLMGVVADRLSLRWYLGYDLYDPLPDHSTLTRIRERFGLSVFRRFFERIVEECIEAGLVWGEEIFFDATKVEANASMESRIPRFSAETHLGELFEGEGMPEAGAQDETSEPSAEADLVVALPAAENQGLRAENATKGDDWISREGKPDRTIVRGGYRRRSDYELSPTDPDASLMQHKRGASRMGYHVHYVVDGGKARVILQALVTPADVTENQPMLDLLFRTIFRWRARTRRVTGDATYGTKEIIAAVEKESIRAYVSMADFEGRSPYYGASRFVYDDKRDLYWCPVGEPLRLYTHSYTERLSRYRADPETCNTCPLKPECTPGGSGRVLMRSFDEELLERVRAYRGTVPYEKALRKRKVWVEPLFGEAKEWHGMRRFRLRRLWRVNAEAMVTAAGQNIKRLLTFSGGGPRRLAQAEALRPPAPTSWANGRHLRGSHRRGSTPLLARFSTG